MTYRYFILGLLMIDKIIQYKEKISILKGLSSDCIKTIISDYKMIRYNENETIIKQGDDTKDVFFLLEGEVKVLVNNIEVAIIHHNQAFGEFSAIAKEKRKATIIAKKPCKIICFSLALDKLKEQHSGFAGLYKNICNELIIKIDEANKRAT